MYVKKNHIQIKHIVKRLKSHFDVFIFVIS